MLHLKCTRQVQRFWKLPLQPAPRAADDPTILGAWYFNFFTVDRRKMTIFVNERTRLSFVLLGPKKSQLQNMHLVFARGVALTLNIAGVHPIHIERVLQDYTEMRFAKTDDRVTLGCMVDIVKEYQFVILDSGGLDFVDLGALIKRQNEVPHRTIGWLKPAQAVHALLRSHGLVTPPPGPGDPVPLQWLN